MTKHLSFDNSTAMYKYLKTYLLAGLEPGIFCSGDYALPPGQKSNFKFLKIFFGPNPSFSFK
jgi:hypothetical protein